MTKERIKVESIAASRIDLAFHCSGSVLPIDEPHSPNVPAARMGTAVHDGLARVALGLEVDLPTLAAKYDVASDELALLLNRGRQALREIREPLRNAKTEIKVNEGDIRCRIDLLGLEMTPAGPNAISVIDHKSGRVQDPKPGQMLGNAVAARRRWGMPSSGYIYTAEIWLRDGEIIERRPDAKRLDAFEERLAETLHYAGRSYTPGEHCGFCPHALNCQPRVDHVRASAEALMVSGGKELTPVELADLWPRTRMLKREIDRYEKTLSQLLDTHGPITLSDGSRIEHREKSRDKIDPKLAWQVMLNRGLTEEQIAGVLSVSKTKLLSTVKDNVPLNAPRGSKGKAVGSLLDALREAKAITTSVYKEKNHVRPKE